MNVTDDNYGEIFDFYEDRGYGFRIGIGANPALIVIDFSSSEFNNLFFNIF